MTTEQQGPFVVWMQKAVQIAAKAVRNFQKRMALIQLARELHKAGKRDEAEGLKGQFDENRQENNLIYRESDKFRTEFKAFFPDHVEQNQFVSGVRKRAIANTFTFRDGKDMINVAGHVMWVVAPWDQGTFAILRMRDRTGVNITDTQADSLKKLIRAAEKLLEELSKTLPSLDDAMAGTVDFTVQQAVEEYDEVAADLAQINTVLGKVQAAQKGRQEEGDFQKKMLDGQGAGDGKGHGQEEKEDPIKRIETQITAKTKAMQAAAGRREYDNAGRMKAKLEELKAELETAKKELRESGAVAMAGRSENVPVVKLAEVMMVDDETGGSVRVEDLVAKYEAQIVENNEAATGHDAEATTAEVEGDQLMTEKKKSEAGTKYSQMETSRKAVEKCRDNVTKLTKKIKELTSHATSERARLAEEAKKKIKGAKIQKGAKQAEEKKETVEFVVSKLASASNVKELMELYAGLDPGELTEQLNLFIAQLTEENTTLRETINGLIAEANELRPSDRKAALTKDNEASELEETELTAVTQMLEWAQAKLAELKVAVNPGPKGAGADDNEPPDEDLVIVNVRSDLKVAIAAGDDAGELKATRRLKALGVA